jgi:hypothetical protein
VCEAIEAEKRLGPALLEGNEPRGNGFGETFPPMDCSARAQIIASIIDHGQLAAALRDGCNACLMRAPIVCGFLPKG